MIERNSIVGRNIIPLFLRDQDHLQPFGMCSAVTRLGFGEAGLTLSDSMAFSEINKLSLRDDWDIRDFKYEKHEKYACSGGPLTEHLLNNWKQLKI